jgi:DNA-binding transcriptional LysR family regulator
MNASVRQLKAFIAVVQSASFTKAAEKLYITQAGLSSMVKDLELQLNCRLLDRTTRMVAPTAAGRRLLPVAMRVVRDLEQVGWEINERNTHGNSILRIGVTPMVASTLAPRVVSGYMKRRAGSRVEVVDTTRQEIQALVEAGELDAGFGIFFTKMAGVTRRALFPAPLMVVAPASGATGSSGQKLQRWSELADRPLVVLPDDNPIQVLVDKHLPKGQGRPAGRMIVRHLEAAISFVEQGFGVAVMPSFAMLACSRYDVTCTVLADPVVPLDYYCITRAGSDVSDAVEELASEFVQAAAQFMPEQ